MTISNAVYVLLLLVSATVAEAQEGPPAKKASIENHSLPLRAMQPYIQSVAIPNDRLEALNGQLRDMTVELRGEIQSLRMSWWEKLLPAGIGFAGILGGTLLGGWITWRSQTRQLTSVQKNARASAAYESVAKIMDFRARQLNEFYSPMLFLLHRTARVRRQLCDLILEQPGASTDFRYKEEADGRKHLWVIDSEGRYEKPFRLIEYMRTLAIDYTSLMPLVDEIVLLGQQITTLVHERGGLSRAENPDLATALGEYLGHYSILKEVHYKAKRDPELLKGVTYSMTYPRHLDGLLDGDIAHLTKIIAQWEAGANIVAGIEQTPSQ